MYEHVKMCHLILLYILAVYFTLIATSLEWDAQPRTPKKAGCTTSRATTVFTHNSFRCQNRARFARRCLDVSHPISPPIRVHVPVQIEYCNYGFMVLQMLSPIEILLWCVSVTGHVINVYQSEVM